MRVTTDDGVRLATVAAGPEDAPGLLLVHGFGGAKEDFADHVDALAVDHRVVVFDHRGHGESDAPDDPAAYSLDRLAADTVAVADAYDLRDLRLLGHSMGGMVTRRVVLAHPERASAWVFMDTSPGPASRASTPTSSRSASPSCRPTAWPRSAAARRARPARIRRRTSGCCGSARASASTPTGSGRRCRR